MRLGYREGELEGDWLLFARIAGPFVNKVPCEDREDFLHDTMLEMAKVKAKYEALGKPLTEAGLMTVASYEFRGYWDKRRYRLYGVNCTHCSSEQRRECRTIPKSQCPKGKAIQLLSLDRVVSGRDGDDGYGDREPIGKATDLDAWVDARRTLRSLPKRVVRTGYKRYCGYALTDTESYLLRRRHKQYSERKKAKIVRVFVYDGREFPDPDLALSPDEVRRMMTDFFPELANAEVREHKKGENTLYELVRRVGRKGKPED